MVAPIGDEGDDGKGEDGAEEAWHEIKDDKEVIETDEVDKIPVANSPVKPNAAEVEEHRVTHLPYRCWCRECVMGRGVGSHRGMHKGRVHEIPRVGVDYFFVTDAGVWRRKELKYGLTEEGDKELREDRKRGVVMKGILIRCHETRCVFAHVVPCKGPDEDSYVVDLITSAVAWLGHTRVILKSDNEVALLAVVKRALEAIKCKVDVSMASSEQSAPYDSQSNGGTEVGVRALRGLVRTVKLCTERRIGREIPPNHPMIAWIIEHAAVLLNACCVGEDGKTGWSRARGRGFGQRLYGFGESVFWKPTAKGPQHNVAGNLGPRLYPGTFVGYHKASNTYRVITEEGDLVKTRGLMRRPLADRWHPEVLEKITVTPWSLRAIKSPDRIELGEEVEKHANVEEESLANPRRLKITMKALKDYGTSEGCPQCTHIQAFGEAKNGLPHSEACRKRIVEAMRAIAAGSERLTRHDLRTDRQIARQIEAEDARAQAPEDA